VAYFCLFELFLFVPLRQRLVALEMPQVLRWSRSADLSRGHRHEQSTHNNQWIRAKVRHLESARLGPSGPHSP
jgi:hypothetical protein